MSSTSRPPSRPPSRIHKATVQRHDAVPPVPSIPQDPDWLGVHVGLKKNMWVRLTENINNIFSQNDIVRVRDVKTSSDPFTSSPERESAALPAQDGVNANATYLVQIEKLYEVHEHDVSAVTDGIGKVQEAAVPQTCLAISKGGASGTPQDLVDTLVYLDIPAHLGKREYYTAPFPEGSRGAGKQFKIVPKETRLRITRQSTSGGLVIQTESRVSMPVYYCLEAAIDIKRFIWVTCEQWVNRRDLQALSIAASKDQDKKASIAATPQYSLASF
ncbi:hypothetical protein C8Q76DRAFT_704469 [Earliella scabrosa]|nr:hypothetical protein C8Q76DRAFT_704469 [Earliella scabrosa]